jgi:hypothetical protein
VHKIILECPKEKNEQLEENTDPRDYKKTRLKKLERYISKSINSLVIIYMCSSSFLHSI